MHLVLLILWTRPSADTTKTSIATNAVAVAGAIVFCMLSYVEHIRSVQPSLLLNVYFLFTLLFDVARARTLWMRKTNESGDMIALAFTATVVLKFVILLFEATEKRWMLRPQYKAYPPEATSGIINRSFFVWINSLFWTGFGKLLVIDDLFALDKHLISERVHNKMHAAWSQGMYPR